MTPPRLDTTDWDAVSEGWQDARQGEPLFEDADPNYRLGWCFYHGIADPYETAPAASTAYVL